MEQKRQKALNMTERMKLQASENIQMGSELYIMHAKCAVEFADLLTELLTTEPIAEPSPDAPIRVTVECDGKKNIYNTNGSFLAFIDPKDGNPTVDFCTRNITMMQKFMFYVVLMQSCNLMAEKTNFKEFYEQGLKEGLFQKKIDLTAQADEASKGGANHD